MFICVGSACRWLDSCVALSSENSNTSTTTPSIAFNLLLVYSLGLGIPFILMGIFYSSATRLIRAMSKHLKYYNVILGAFIIILGVLVFTNQLAYIANFPLLNELVLLG